MRIPPELRSAQAAQPRSALHTPLGYRLGHLGSLLPAADRTLADIGSDHGLLPDTLLQRGHLDRAFAIDIHDGPIALMKRRQERGALSADLQIGAGSGLQPLIKAGESDIHALTIAGMGGKTIVEILRPEHLDQAAVRTLLLQPLDHHAELLGHLRRSGWAVERGLVIADQQRLYLLFRATQAGASPVETQATYVADHVPPLRDLVGGGLHAHWLRVQTAHWKRVATSAQHRERAQAVVAGLEASLREIPLPDDA